MSENMSFGARMLAKYGYKEGDGLGASGTGISAPIEGLSNNRRDGLGYGLGPTPVSQLLPSTNTSDASGQVDFKPSKFVIIFDLEQNIGASSVYEMFRADPDLEHGKGLVEITINCNHGIAEFKTEDIAQKAIQMWNGEPFGWNGRKVVLHPLDAKDVPEPNENVNGPSLSKFLAQERDNRKVSSQTVLLTGLTSHHEQRWLNLLVGDTTSTLVGTDMYDELEDDPNYELWCIKSHVADPGSGSVLAKFNHEQHADNFAESWNGTYFKSRTIYAKRVPDAEIDDIIEEKVRAQEEIAQNPRSGLFIKPVPRGTTQEDIQNIFPNHTVHAVNFPPSGGTAIAFLDAKDADDILQKYPYGITARGRKYFVSTFEFGKKKKQNKRGPANRGRPADNSVEGITKQASNLQVNSGGKNFKGNNRGRGESFDVILKGLHYDADEANVRELFEGFAIRRINFPQHKKGIAFVALPTAEEQQRATRTLNGLKVLGRKVFIEVVKPKA